MRPVVGASEIWEGSGQLPWKLTLVYRGVEKTIPFPDRVAAESYLAFLTAWEDEPSVKLEIS